MPDLPKSTKSPLTIIAIFAAIVEASALASLPFLKEQSQDIYTWFLVGFPPFLTLLFFITLNFNYKVFYSPSDFSNETDFLTIYDKALHNDAPKHNQPAPENTASDPPINSPPNPLISAVRPTVQIEAPTQDKPYFSFIATQTYLLDCNNVESEEQAMEVIEYILAQPSAKHTSDSTLPKALILLIAGEQAEQRIRNMLTQQLTPGSPYLADYVISAYNLNTRTLVSLTRKTLTP